MYNKNDRRAAIQKHLSDQLAVVRHVLEASARQRTEDMVRRNKEAVELIVDIERTLRDHASTLERMVDDWEAEPQSKVKKAVTEILGAAAGLYDRVREQQVSRILRDDYTALSLLAMGYTAMHTFGLAIKEEELATVALGHLRDITPLCIRLSRTLPLVVSDEITMESSFETDPNAGKVAQENTQQAWSHEATGYYTTSKAETEAFSHRREGMERPVEAEPAEETTSDIGSYDPNSGLMSAPENLPPNVTP